MKKIWFMLLLVCSACAFTACSDDDPQLPLSERITVTEMPKEIVLGEKAEIKAKGFVTTATLALENKAQGNVKLNDAVFTETTVTFTVPDDRTLIDETFSVILTQEEETLTLGEVKIVDKPRPVKDIVIPNRIMIGDNATVEGKGFNETSKLIFTHEEEEFSFTAELSQVTNENAVFTVPVEAPIGTYSVSLSQNDWTWELELTTEVVEKITSLQMPARIYMGKEAKIFGGFNVTNDKIVLRNTAGKQIDITAKFTESYASFIVPSDLSAKEFYNVLLVNGEKEWPLGEIEAMNPITKRITKITYYDESEEPWTWELKYDDHNRISQIITELFEEQTVYQIEYTDTKITISSEDEHHIYTLAGSRVATSESVDEEFSYTWNYTTQNYLSSVNDDEDEDGTISYDFTDRNLVSVGYSELKYSNPTQINYLEIGDPVACIYKFFLQAMENHQFFSFLLGISGNHSANLPTNLGEEYDSAQIEYEGGDYITSASTSSYDEYEDETYTKRIDFEYEDYNE